MESKANKRPNILLIMCDQLRYDTFSYMNHPVVETPNIDSLVNQGILFSQATCSSPVCGPSRAGMLTGLYPTQGHYREKNGEPEDENNFWLKDVKTCDEILAESGYHVQYHGKWHCGAEHFSGYRGDKRVFGHNLYEYHNLLEASYDMSDSEEYRMERYTRWPYRYNWIDDVFTDENCGEYAMYKRSNHGIFDVEDKHSLTAFTVDKTVRFLNEYEDNDPFCVTCSILHPHLPFVATPKYANMYKPEDIPLPKNMLSHFPGMINTLGGKKVPIPKPFAPDMLKERLALYYGLIKEIDDHVGRLITALEENGLRDDTIIIFTSDHGSMMGAHGLMMKMVFFEESVRVPLIINCPARIKGPAVSDSPVNGVDLYPTILDFCGVNQFNDIHGISLKCETEGMSINREYAFSTLHGNHCLRNKKWKAMFRGETMEYLFDLENDPLETNNFLTGSKNKHITDKITKEMKLSLLFDDYTFKPFPLNLYMHKDDSEERFAHLRPY